MLRNGHPQPLIVVKKKHVTYEKVRLKDIYLDKEKIKKAENFGEEWYDESPTTILLAVKYKFIDYNNDNKEEDMIIVADKDLREEDYEDFIIKQLKIFEKNLRDNYVRKLMDTLPEEDWNMIQSSNEYED